MTIGIKTPVYMIAHAAQYAGFLSDPVTYTVSKLDQLMNVLNLHITIANRDNHIAQAITQCSIIAHSFTLQAMFKWRQTEVKLAVAEVK